MDKKNRTPFVPGRKSTISLFVIRLVCAFCLVALAVSFVLTQADVIVMYFIGRSSGFEISSGARHGNSFRLLSLDDLKMRSTKDNFAVTIDNAHFNIRWDESFSARKFIVDCIFDGVRFYTEGDESEQLGTPAEKSSLDALLKVPFRSKWKYRLVTFSGIAGGNELSVRSFRSISDNIMVAGEYVFHSRTGDFNATLSMSFSPEASKPLLHDFGDMFLIEKDDGWYGVNMSTKGNIRDGSFHVESDRIEIKIHAGER